MTSLFTRFVAQGVEVQVEQSTHLNASEVVTQDVGQAATVEATVTTSEIQTSGTTEVINAVDGTPSPK